MELYSTIDWLPDMTTSKMSEATFLNLSPYTPISSFIGWDNSVIYTTDKDYADLYDDFKWLAKEGATYDIFSRSWYDPYIIIIYDKYGNAIETGSDGSYGSDHVFDFIAPYSGEFYVSASWNQGLYYKDVSISIYEDIDTAVVVKNTPPTGTVKVSGTATQGQTLSVANTLVDIDGVISTIIYQWLADGSIINGATASTLTLGQAQVGKTISVKASYTDKLGTAESVSSISTAKVANINDAGVVQISGTATQGQALKAAVSDVDGMPTTGLKYQWFADGSVISGATASTFTLGQVQVGKAISVKVSYTDKLGTAENVSSSVTTKVANINDAGVVKVSGTATQGQVLKAAVSDADGMPTTGLKYQWLADDSAISGATASTFTLGQAQVGKTISLKASYIDKLGTAESKISASTAMIASPSQTGTTGKDVLGGSTGNDLLSGNSGNDIIYGGMGNDTLIGGAGFDLLKGGAGNDSFKFTALTDLGLGATARDVIADFKRGMDKIDLSAIDANSEIKNDQAFVWVNSFSSTAGQVRFITDGNGNGAIYLNTDKDVAIEFAITLTGVTTLAASDLIL